MIDKIVLHTVEKKSKRQIPMVLICRDSAQKDSGVVQVIFGANKPGAMGVSLLPFIRQPIDTKDYHLLAMDLYLPTKIRHTVFGMVDQKIAWEKAAKAADRFIIKAGTMGRARRGNKPRYTKKYLESIQQDNRHTNLAPPVAILITNSNALEKDLNKRYTSSKQNE